MLEDLFSVIESGLEDDIEGMVDDLPAEDLSASETFADMGMIPAEDMWGDTESDVGSTEDVWSDDLLDFDGERLFFGSVSEEQEEALERAQKLEDLQQEYDDAAHDLERAQKELDDLLDDKADGWIGIDPAIGWQEAHIKDAQQRMNEIEREMSRL